MALIITLDNHANSLGISGSEAHRRIPCGIIENNHLADLDGGIPIETLPMPRTYLG
jgi:hypothetical protein